MGSVGVRLSFEFAVEPIRGRPGGSISGPRRGFDPASIEGGAIWVDAGSMWGRPGTDLGSIRSRFRVHPGPVWARRGVELGPRPPPGPDPSDVCAGDPGAAVEQALVGQRLPLPDLARPEVRYGAVDVLPRPARRAQGGVPSYRRDRRLRHGLAGARRHRGVALLALGLFDVALRDGLRSGARHVPSPPAPLALFSSRFSRLKGRRAGRRRCAETTGGRGGGIGGHDVARARVCHNDTARCRLRHTRPAAGAGRAADARTSWARRRCLQSTSYMLLEVRPLAPVHTTCIRVACPRHLRLAPHAHPLVIVPHGRPLPGRG